MDCLEFGIWYLVISLLDLRVNRNLIPPVKNNTPGEVEPQYFALLRCDPDRLILHDRYERGVLGENIERPLKIDRRNRARLAFPDDFFLADN